MQNGPISFDMKTAVIKMKTMMIYEFCVQ
jgi:hypothetical protein